MRERQTSEVDNYSFGVLNLEVLSGLQGIRITSEKIAQGRISGAHLGESRRLPPWRSRGRLSLER